ncbi:MAG: MotA/TolQ/ExbB proton channel family protein [Planctomycetota bacterium]|jgi:biopolymer transport protein ExbB
MIALQQQALEETPELVKEEIRIPSFPELVDEALRIWDDGGQTMYFIAAIALVMFGVGVSVALRLLQANMGRVNEETWRRWIENPKEAQGKLGRLLIRLKGVRNLEDIAGRFDAVRAAELAPFERDLKVMKVCVSAAPLVGLLGTVMGMLETFSALSSGGGGDQTMVKIAAGISEALITTETGLVIALPGLFFQYLLVRGFEGYKAFLVRFETVFTQSFYRRNSPRRARAISAAPKAVATA